MQLNCVWLIDCSWSSQSNCVVWLWFNWTCCSCISNVTCRLQSNCVSYGVRLQLNCVWSIAVGYRSLTVFRDCGSIGSVIAVVRLCLMCNCELRLDCIQSIVVGGLWFDCDRDCVIIVFWEAAFELHFVIAVKLCSFQSQLDCNWLNAIAVQSGIAVLVRTSLCIIMWLWTGLELRPAIEMRLNWVPNFAVQSWLLGCVSVIASFGIIIIRSHIWHSNQPLYFSTPLKL